MAAEQNIIEVIIKSVNQMSAELGRIENDMRKLEGATGKTDKAMTSVSGSSQNFRRTLQPMRSLISQVTGALAEQSGGMQVLIANVDNAAFSLAAFGLKAGAIGAALTILVGVVAFFVKRWLDVKNAIAAGQQAFDDMDVAMARLKKSTEAEAITAERQVRVQQIIRKTIEETNKTIPDKAKLIELGNELMLVQDKEILALTMLQKNVLQAAQALAKENEILDIQVNLFGRDKDVMEQVIEVLKIMQALEDVELTLGDKRAAALLKQLERNLQLRQDLRLQTADREERIKGIKREMEIAEASAKDDVQLAQMRAEGLRRIGQLEIEMAEIGKTASEKRIAQIQREGEEFQEFLDMLALQFPELAERVADAMGGLSAVLKEKVGDVLEEEARTAAQGFVDRFLSVMETGELDLSSFMRGLGKTLVADFLEEFLTQALLVSGLITGGKSLGATVGLGLFDFLRGLLSGAGGENKPLAATQTTDLTKLAKEIGSSTVKALDDIGAASTALAATGLDAAALSLGNASVSLQGAAAALVNAAAAMSGGGFGGFSFGGGGWDWSQIADSLDIMFAEARGGYLPGNFVPVGALRKFAAGGMAGGPTLGVIGEEGPEIVARMKPARPGDTGGGNIEQRIFLVDQRPPRIGPRDVVLYVAADMRAGGRAADAVLNVIKRV